MPDRYGVIGHPITHSKSPVIHAQFAEQTGEDIRYEAVDIPPVQLKQRILRLVNAGMRGFNVTVPHKEAVAALVDTCTPRAELAGAVNTVTVGKDGQLSGDNTDGVGLVRDLSENLAISLQGTRILILGAGGAARGIVPALLMSGPTELCVANRTVTRAEELAEQFKELGEIRACAFQALDDQDWDIVINATSAGLQGEGAPFPGSIVSERTICYDLSYAMSETPFVSWAKSEGAKAAYQGWGMLVEQAAEAFNIWRGVRPETDSVRRRLP
ncbi:MAG: shikimate dehydrogenase [Gammaproteobacteria bacterium]